MIYQGQEQGFSGEGVPSNREALWTSGFSTTSELYQFTKLMNQIRRHATAVNRDYLSYQSHVIYSDNETVVYRKGREGRQIVSVFSSGGKQTRDYRLTLPIAFSTGSMVTDVVACANHTINEYGQLMLPMAGGLPHVLFPAAKMNGSQLCGFTDLPLAGRMMGGAAGTLRQSGSLSSLLAAVMVVTVMALRLV